MPEGEKMPEKYIAQYKAQDNCMYFLNAETGRIQKICDVEVKDELPAEVLAHFRKIADAVNRLK
jgi:hypothetical protein